MFAALPVMGVQALAAPETVEVKIGAETIKMICEKQGIDYDFCKAAILKLNEGIKDPEFAEIASRMENERLQPSVLSRRLRHITINYL